MNDKRKYRNKLKGAEIEYKNAYKKRLESQNISKKLKDDLKKNHYADMIYRALKGH